RMDAMKLPEFTYEKTIDSARTTHPSMEPKARDQSKRKSTLSSISVSKSTDPRLSASLYRKENNEQAELHQDQCRRGRCDGSGSSDLNSAHSGTVESYKSPYLCGCVTYICC